MNSPHAESSILTSQPRQITPFKKALFATFVTCSLLFTLNGSVLTAQQGPAEKGPGSTLCKYIPQLCGGW